MDRPSTLSKNISIVPKNPKPPASTPEKLVLAAQESNDTTKIKIAEHIFKAQKLRDKLINSRTNLSDKKPPLGL